MFLVPATKLSMDELALNIKEIIKDLKIVIGVTIGNQTADPKKMLTHYRDFLFSFNGKKEGKWNLAGIQPV